LAGGAMLGILLLGIVACIGGGVVLVARGQVLGVLFVLGVIVLIIGLRGLFVVNPNEAMVLQLFGSYVGSAKAPGFHWANPFLSRKKISLRIRNFESAKLKVNDHD